jgi:vancomycin resistance protein VanJ
MNLKMVKFLQTSIWLYVGFIGVWLCLRSIFFDRMWWLALLNTMAFYLLLPSILLMAIAIYLNWQRLGSRWLIIGSLFPLLLFGSSIGKLLTPPILKSSQEDRANSRVSTTFTVMSFNVLWNNDNHQKIVRTIRDSHPDIIALQELRPHHITELTAALKDYPYSAFHPIDRYHNIGVFSRLPIQSVTILPDPPMERGMSVIVNVNGRLLTAIVAHLTPNNFQLDPLDRVADSVRERYQRRAAEVEKLLEIIDRSPHPAILMCDCNMTDSSQSYDRLQMKLRDSFKEVGWGLGNTFQGESWQFPRQRIDYIWHTNNVIAIASKVAFDGGSDHLPIATEFRWGKRSAIE